MGYLFLPRVLKLQNYCHCSYRCPTLLLVALPAGWSFDLVAPLVPDYSQIDTQYLEVSLRSL